MLTFYNKYVSLGLQFRKLVSKRFTITAVGCIFISFPPFSLGPNLLSRAHFPPTFLFFPTFNKRETLSPLKKKSKTSLLLIALLIVYSFVAAPGLPTFSLSIWLKLGRRPILKPKLSHSYR